MAHVENDYREELAAAAKAAGLMPPAIVVPENHEVMLGGLRFHYLDWGNTECPTVVLLHGGSQKTQTGRVRRGAPSSGGSAWRRRRVAKTLRRRPRCTAPRAPPSQAGTARATGPRRHPLGSSGSNKPV